MNDSPDVAGMDESSKRETRQILHKSPHLCRGSGLSVESTLGTLLSRMSAP